jgi:hypothetical protein
MDNQNQNQNDNQNNNNRIDMMYFLVQLIENNIDFSSLNGHDFSFFDSLRESFLNLGEQNQVEIRNSAYEVVNHEEEKVVELFLAERNKWITENEINIEGYTFELSGIVKRCLMIVYYHSDSSELDINSVINECYRYRCNCVYNMDEQLIKRIIKQSIFYTGEIPNCEYFPHFVEYYLLHGRIPKDEELNEYMRRVYEFSRSPEDFYQVDKCLVPVLGVEKLPIFEYKVESKSENKSDDVCCICQEEFVENQNVIKLVPCGHLFHHSSKDCLEIGSILDWLKTNNRCPLCKEKVEPI